MKVVLSGSSGFLGTALRDRLARAGHDVVRLVRREAQSPSESSWDPSAGRVDSSVLASADVVVNLSGAPLVRWPMTQSYRQTVRTSRVDTTRTLAQALAGLPDPPALLNQSAIGFYGVDRGSEPLDEQAEGGSGFLAAIVRQWEESTAAAGSAAVRVCHLRTGVVLDRRGGALQVMLWPFRLGLGGRLGSGEQYFSVVSLDDWCSAVLFLAEHEQAAGTFNVSMPNPPTNAEFTAELGRQLHRPTPFVVPATPMRLVLGDLAGQLLGSLRVEPVRLREAGFVFTGDSLSIALASALG